MHVSQMFVWLKSMIPHAFGEAAGKGLSDLFKNGMEGLGKVTREKVVETILQHHRSEFARFLYRLIDQDGTTRSRDAIIGRHRVWVAKSRSPESLGDARIENRTVNLLIALYLSFPEGYEEERREEFLRIGHMKDPEFEQLLDLLENDVLASWLREARFWLNRAGGGIKTVYTVFDANIRPVADVLDDARKSRRERRVKAFAEGGRLRRFLARFSYN